MGWDGPSKKNVINPAAQVERLAILVDPFFVPGVGSALSQVLQVVFFYPGLVPSVIRSEVGLAAIVMVEWEQAGIEISHDHYCAFRKLRRQHVSHVVSELLLEFFV